MLGGSHDNGYSVAVQRLEAQQRRKIVLLRTSSYCAESILRLGLEEVRFEGLFEGRNPPKRGAFTPFCSTGCY